MEYAIVDIETTGSYAAGNRITEIAIIIHNGTYVLEKFQTLLNPETFIPFHIQALTGISDEMVEDAPTFKQVAKKINDLLAKRVFVAHNVNFDYSFIVNELKNAGFSWKAPKLCTVRLSRKIIPNQASYSLGKLCQNLNIPIYDRHRAMGDAEATVLLFEKLMREDSQNIITSTLKKTIEHRLPTHIDEEDFVQLPEKAGIYLFKDKQGKIIYVGKAINIKNRVLGHFSGNSGSSKRQSFIDEIRSIEFQESGTELMALLMECQMIKQYWPKHNRALKKFEPKFSLIQYEDQLGFIRLLVSPYDKHALAIQHFERPLEANQMLLDMMNKYDLDNRLCYFYSVNTDNKNKYLSLEDIEVQMHNEKVEQAIAEIIEKRSTFVIFDRGRTIDEKSYIYFKNDQLYAFGFLHADNQFDNIEDAISPKDRCTSNYYMTSLVFQYAERFPSKVIQLDSKTFDFN